jgi:hypothetical protein
VGGGGGKAGERNVREYLRSKNPLGGGGTGQGPAAVIYIHTYVHIVQLAAQRVTREEEMQR